MADPQQVAFRLAQTVKPEPHLDCERGITGDDIVGAIEHRLSNPRLVIECPDMDLSSDRMKLTDNRRGCQSAGEREKINVNLAEIADARGKDQSEFDLRSDATHLAQQFDIE